MKRSERHTCASIIWQLRRVHPQPTSLVNSSQPTRATFIIRCNACAATVHAHEVHCSSQHNCEGSMADHKVDLPLLTGNFCQHPFKTSEKYHMTLQVWKHLLASIEIKVHFTKHQHKALQRKICLVTNATFLTKRS
jgi:hypothetical protein